MTTIPQAVTRALAHLNIPLVGGLSRDELLPFVVVWRQRVYDFVPEKKVKDKVELGPPPLTPPQVKVLDGWGVGEVRTKEETGASISSLRALAKKGFVEGMEGEEEWVRTG